MMSGQAGSLEGQLVPLVEVLAGVFDGLEEIVSRRLRIGTGRMGFGVSGSAVENMDTHESFSQVTPDDLVQFGILPEVAGRIRDVVVMRNLSRDDL